MCPVIAHGHMSTTTLPSQPTVKGISQHFWNFFFFFDTRFTFPQQIFFLITPPEGPLWKQCHIDLFNAILAILTWGVFKLNF